jgi:hypothetical protein
MKRFPSSKGVLARDTMGISEERHTFGNLKGHRDWSFDHHSENMSAIIRIGRLFRVAFIGM